VSRPGAVLRSALARWRRDGVPGFRTAKLTFAAVLAFAVASWLDTSADRILAPLTALLVLQGTVFATLMMGMERVVSVPAGVLVAVVVGSVAGLTWWSLGLAVLASLLIGKLLRLGPHLMEVPISAMIVLALGADAGPAFGRVSETFIGAAVGLAVNFLVVPPVKVRPASDAVGRLADVLADFMDELAGQLGEGWSRAAADEWLQRARGLDREVERADRGVEQAEESARLNPRGAKARTAQPRLRTALTALEHCYVSLRNLCRALLDRTFFVPEHEQGQAYPEPVRAALASVLRTAADAVRGAGAHGSGSEPLDVTLAEVALRLTELQAGRDELAALLVVDPRVDQGAWQQHGALLAAVDRLKIEVEAAVQPPGEAWRPVPLTERQRQAVRRALEASRRRSGTPPRPRPARRQLPWRRG
jgi:hypothetical protein